VWCGLLVALTFWQSFCKKNKKYLSDFSMSYVDPSSASENEVEFAPSPRKDNRNFCSKLYDAIVLSIPGPVKVPKEYQGLDYTYG
jgi:hypothetical protein